MEAGRWVGRAVIGFETNGLGGWRKEMEGAGWYWAKAKIVIGLNLWFRLVY